MVHMDGVNDEELNNSPNDYEFSSLSAKSAARHTLTTTSPASESNSIILYPFAHQVGGHTQLLTLDKSTLCKPLIPRELLFYLNVPKELVNFVPSYKGVVQIRETGQGTYPPVVYQPLRSGFSFELKVQIRPCPDEKVLKKNLSQDNLLKADYISRPNEKYLLLLENVASKYQLPCILDLKMGTRQHGDDATEEKRDRQIAKCQASTSASLGVRLCGMQVYQVDYGGFLWYDKYYGRQMNEDGLKRALHEYFRNGSQLNQDIIDDVIERLKLLSEAVEKSPSFRFYGTSLLIIHEGCTTSRSSNDINDCNIKTTKNIDSDTKEIGAAALIEAASLDSNQTTTTTTTSAKTSSSLNNKISKSKRCQVDVRLIDFAHTICDYSCTNGRSISSPSVLTSASAENLSSVPETSSDPPLSAHHNAPPTNHLRAPTQTRLMHCAKLADDPLDYALEHDESGAACRPSSQILDIEGALSKHPGIELEDEDEIEAIKLGNKKDCSNKNGFISAPNSTSSGISAAGGRHQNPAATLKTMHDIEQQQQQQQQQPTSKQQIRSTPTSPPSLAATRKVSRNSIGPDKGLLFGLENLMRLLDDLKTETLLTC